MMVIQKIWGFLYLSIYEIYSINKGKFFFEKKQDNFFFINVKNLHCLELVYSKNDFNLYIIQNGSNRIFQLPSQLGL